MASPSVAFGKYPFDWFEFLFLVLAKCCFAKDLCACSKIIGLIPASLLGFNCCYLYTVLYPCLPKYIILTFRSCVASSSIVTAKYLRFILLIDLEVPDHHVYMCLILVRAPWLYHNMQITLWWERVSEEEITW